MESVEPRQQPSSRQLNKLLQLYTSSLRKKPDDLTLRTKLAEVLRLLGRKDDSISLYSSVAWSYGVVGNLAQAIMLCKIILELNPDHIATQQMLAKLYASKKIREQKHAIPVKLVNGRWIADPKEKDDSAKGSASPDPDELDKAIRDYEANAAKGEASEKISKEREQIVADRDADREGLSQDGEQPPAAQQKPDQFDAGRSRQYNESVSSAREASSQSEIQQSEGSDNQPSPQQLSVSMLETPIRNVPPVPDPEDVKEAGRKAHSAPLLQVPTTKKVDLRREGEPEKPPIVVTSDRGKLRLDPDVTTSKEESRVTVRLTLEEAEKAIAKKALTETPGSDPRSTRSAEQKRERKKSPAQPEAARLRADRAQPRAQPEKASPPEVHRPRKVRPSAEPKQSAQQPEVRRAKEAELKRAQHEKRPTSAAERGASSPAKKGQEAKSSFAQKMAAHRKKRETLGYRETTKRPTQHKHLLPTTRQYATTRKAAESSPSSSEKERATPHQEALTNGGEGPSSPRAPAPEQTAGRQQQAPTERQEGSSQSASLQTDMVSDGHTLLQAEAIPFDEVMVQAVIEMQDQGVEMKLAGSKSYKTIQAEVQEAGNQQADQEIPAYQQEEAERSLLDTIREIPDKIHPHFSEEELPSMPFPLFSDLDPPAFLEIVDKLERRIYPAGSLIFEEGDPGDSLFLVSSGQLQVLKNDVEGCQIELARLRTGSFFGEFGLLTDRTRHASVRCLEECELLELHREVLSSVIQKHSSVAWTLRIFYQQRVMAMVLATSRLFRMVKPGDRKVILSRFGIRRYIEGEVIIEEGKSGSGFYVILVGEVTVTCTAPDMSLVTVGTLSEGDYFGEMSMLTGNLAEATVKASRVTEVLVLNSKDFYTLASNHPEIWAELHEEAERRHRVTAELLANRVKVAGDLCLI